MEETADIPNKYMEVSSLPINSPIYAYPKLPLPLVPLGSECAIIRIKNLDEYRQKISIIGHNNEYKKAKGPFQLATLKSYGVDPIGTHGGDGSAVVELSDGTELKQNVGNVGGFESFYFVVPNVFTKVAFSFPPGNNCINKTYIFAGKFNVRHMKDTIRHIMKCGPDADQYRILLHDTSTATELTDDFKMIYELGETANISVRFEVIREWLPGSLRGGRNSVKKRLHRRKLSNKKSNINP